MKTKDQIRAEKQAHRIKKHNLIQPQVLNFPPPVEQIPTSAVDCACLIHGDAYDWSYVDKLYNMLQRNLSRPVRLHVYTEAKRPVPAPYVKHELHDWGVSGPKKSWWYKLQLFNNEHHAGPLIYFDLDTVIVNNIDWLWKLSMRKFWSVRDFKHIWRNDWAGLNSSVMVWDTTQYHNVYEGFIKQDIRYLMRKYHGDQDYITAVLPQTQVRFFDPGWVKSWRWQCLDGGYDFKRRIWHNPGQGTTITPETSILIFHGHPKPSDVEDPVIQKYWQ